MSTVVVVPWVSDNQLKLFLQAWHIDPFHIPDYELLLVHDSRREGCAVTKNRGVAEARRRGADVVVVLDDDCYPDGEVRTLGDLIEGHEAALRPQRVRMFEAVTDPPSRGTPYGDLTVEMPVAASMGFWTGVGDYCAVRQLATGAPPMAHRREPVHGRYFPLCGMNLAFRPAEWESWCTFVDVPRFDDIWMGWLWQKEAYRRGHCFNLAGPVVRHSRQSDPWRNLAVEARHLAASEKLWAAIHHSLETDYAALRALLPEDAGGSDR